MSGREPYVVYVDEAGDRGWGGRASPFFVLSAVVVRQRDDTALRKMLDGLISDLGRQPGAVLHWSQNIRDHIERKHVSRQLAALPATFVNVILCKQSLYASGTALNVPAHQYSYPVRRLLERVSWYVDQQSGVATLRFGHVRRFKYDHLTTYLQRLHQRSDCTITWAALTNGTNPKIEQPTQIRGLQVADLVAGCVYAAVRQDRYGHPEPAYLQTIAGQLWRGPSNRLDIYGLHSICGANHKCLDHYPWWQDLIQAPRKH